MGTCNFAQDAVTSQQDEQTSDTGSPLALLFRASRGGIEVGADVTIVQAVEDTLPSADNLQQGPSVGDQGLGARW